MIKNEDFKQLQELMKHQLQGVLDAIQMGSDGFEECIEDIVDDANKLMQEFADRHEPKEEVVETVKTPHAWKEYSSEWAWCCRTLNSISHYDLHTNAEDTVMGEAIRNTAIGYRKEQVLERIIFGREFRKRIEKVQKETKQVTIFDQLKE